MPNNYDAAAWFYDGLAQLIFGKALVNAQRCLVRHIKARSNLLIVGGGTGWILEEIAKVQPHGLNITYVEISGRMIDLSKTRNCGQNEVGFVHAAIEDCEMIQTYDAILTPFLFDNFSEKHIQNVFTQLHQSLKLDGLWMLTDFQIQNNYKSIWQKIILKTMYLFFGWLCNVETKTLVKMDTYFAQKNYTLAEEKTFYKGFVVSQVYHKN